MPGGRSAIASRREREAVTLLLLLRSRAVDARHLGHAATIERLPIERFALALVVAAATVPTTLILPQQDQSEHDFRLGDVQNTRNIELDEIVRREVKS
jgi:hypothetical protein